MKSKIFRALIEMGFIIFLFYSNLLMGEYERSNGMHKNFTSALEDIFTVTNLEIALVAAFMGYAVFEFLRRKF